MLDVEVYNDKTFTGTVSLFEDEDYNKDDLINILNEGIYENLEGGLFSINDYIIS